jgi:ABC-2 type transport system permease protein
MTTHTIEQNTTNTKAASFGRQIWAQTQVELLMTLRRGESVLITLIVPVILLIFFTSLNIVPATNGKAVNFLLPGMLALAIMATGMVSLGIATAYERYYGVLKRLGSSPLPSRGPVLWLATGRVTLAGFVRNGYRNDNLFGIGTGNGRSAAC